MKPWWMRRPVAALMILVAFMLPCGIAGVLAADSLYHLRFGGWGLTSGQLGLCLGGELFGMAIGLTIVMIIGGRHDKRTR